MAKKLQYGCKKCGGVITVEIQPWTDRVDVRIKDGRIYDHFGELQVQCKKCNKPVAVLSFEEA